MFKDTVSSWTVMIAIAIVWIVVVLGMMNFDNSQQPQNAIFSFGQIETITRNSLVISGTTYDLAEDFDQNVFDFYPGQMVRFKYYDMMIQTDAIIYIENYAQ